MYNQSYYDIVPYLFSIVTILVVCLYGTIYGTIHTDTNTPATDTNTDVLREGQKFPSFPSHCLILCKTKQYYCLICFSLVIFPIPNSFLSLSPNIMYSSLSLYHRY